MRLLSVLGRVAVVAVIIAVPYLLLWVVAVAMIILSCGRREFYFIIIIFSFSFCSFFFLFLFFLFLFLFFRVWGFVYMPPGGGLVCWVTR